MKSGMSIDGLTALIARQNEQKVDYLVPMGSIHLTETGEMWLGSYGTFSVTKHAHRQIAKAIKIPLQYYWRMLDESPDLLAKNINFWFHTSGRMNKKRMIRTLDGRVRAFLSDRYRPLDHADLVETLFPSLSSAGAEIESCAVTNAHFYLKAVVSGIQEEIGPPEGYVWGHGNTMIDIVQPGVVVSNSEIGKGFLRVCPAIHTVACTNLAIYSDVSWENPALIKRHIGRRLKQRGGEKYGYICDETMRSSDAATWARVSDIAVAAMDGSAFRDTVKKLRRARGHRIIDLVRTVENLSECHRLSKTEQESILGYWEGNGDCSRYGLHSAITRASADVESYDRATELESLGGEVIELAPSDWEQIAA